ncbi:MAG: helix-turn-helix transcriptional regulator [Solirubrobacteraceae bacterium]|jgi:PadR family transcriptional regulator PadR
MRRTRALIKVVEILMEDPNGQHWGYDISRRAGVRSGVLYPILQRLLDYGWLEDGWEDRAEISEKRPPRRYYQVTAEGQTELARVLKDAYAAAPLGRLAERPA